MKNTGLRKILDLTLGLTLVGIGILGGLIPVLQGWVFIIAGLAILSRYDRRASALYDRVRGVGRAIRESLARRRRPEDPRGG